ncbi:hypothetical protein CO661_00315 [Sinorhizobium fredii]|uniref:TnsA endonuclease N-terminal domain-containing protein n=1 Tax=Rhizobium fredii TaxID=380 RepID=A0A2A6M6H5_RHIFR|nr:hypothetical protein [Sinorhizobium fredii]PDT50147.1 hypothetical protein CO661_00315 [Sinorhizobium fredii]
MGISEDKGSVANAGHASHQVFHSIPTIKCEGLRVYRSQTARDVGCLLDVNPSVVSWRCQPVALRVGNYSHIADFLMSDDNGLSWLLDAPDRLGQAHQEAVTKSASDKGLKYRLLSRDEVYSGFRLRNAKDLLRYGGQHVSLGDRIRLLAALDEHGPLPFGECLKTILETKPVAGVAALILGGFIEVDLDEGPIGPETMVRRIAA